MRYKEISKNKYKLLSKEKMRIKFHRVERKKEEAVFKSNLQIKADEVFLIDENDEAIGNIPLEDALEKAKDVDLDLVEVNPKANPPVCKIVNLGQLKYERDKLAHKQKMQQKKIDTKNIRLSFRISEHDLKMRQTQAEKFLAKDNKIKVELFLKGRERQYPKKAADIINNFVAELQTKDDINAEIEQPLTKQGGRFTIILINKK
ncbi:MAG TPA: translation initiation factor IF-3 [Patescibacteria group bacterium]|nr:translation initiation factor IF-3 [Patescibacteria group bacterium]